MTLGTNSLLVDWNNDGNFGWSSIPLLWRFNETTGTVAADYYKKYGLTLYGSPSWVTGKLNNAIQLIGSSQYGLLAGAVGLPSIAMTIAGWIKLDSLANWYAVAGHDKGSNGGWWIFVDAAGTLYLTVKSGGVEYNASKTGVIAGTWHHIAGIYDGSNVTIYLDGVAGTDVALVGAVLNSQGDVYVGHDASVGSYWNGKIDELYLFITALSVADILKLKNLQDIYLEEDVSSRTLEVSCSRGRDYASQLTGKSISGVLRATLNNESGDYSSFNTGSPIAGNIVPGRKVQIQSGTGSFPYTFPLIFNDNPVWTGYLQSLKPYPSAIGINTVELVAIGSLGYLNQRETEVAMKTTIATGAEITEILDKATWSASARTLDTGQTTMDRFWQDKVKTLTALRKVEETESGFLTESAAGYIVFEDRHHRMKSPHLTSQATYTDAPGGAIGYIRIGQEDPLQQIFNIFEAEVKTYTAGSSATLWTCPESGADSPMIPAGGSKTFWASYPNTDSATNALAVDAWTTPVASTDFVANTAADGSGTNITASVTITETKFSNAMKMVVTNGASQHAYLTTFQARGTPLTVSDPVKVRVENSTSKTAYGERTYPHPGEFIPDSGEAQDWCDFNMAVFKDPQPVLLIALHANRSHSHLVEALTREISDRITLVANNSAGLGINQDFFIETIYHEMRQDLSHKVTFALSPASMWGGFFILDTSVLDTGRLAY